MTTPNHSDRPTHVLVTAANIFQALSPSRLGLLLVIYGGDTQSQEEISEAIGRTQSTVSTYLQSLETLSPPLAAKQGRYYTVTSTGEKVISLVDGMARRHDIDLSSVDWTAENDRDRIDSLLSPLHDSRGLRPIFILESLYERSEIDGPHGTPRSVRFDDVVRDVEARHADIGENTTTKQVRRTVKLRFDETQKAHFENRSVTLTKKGHHLAWIVTELVQYLKSQDEISRAERTDAARMYKTLTAGSEEASTSQPVSASTERSHRASGVSDSSQQRLSGTSRSDSQLPTEKPSVIPVYTVRSNEEQPGDQDSLPVLPLTAEITVEDLATRVTQFANEYGQNTPLVLDWMLQTESGIHPLATTDTDTDTDTDDTDTDVDTSDVGLEIPNG